MQTEPGRPEPPFNLALLLAANDHPREARRLLRAMLEEHPDHAWGHYQLGTLDQASGKRGRAMRHYREAFRLDPTLSDPSHNPHVLDNSLATAAMLEAFALIAPAVTSQRIYVEPRHITGLLLQPLSSPATEPMTETGEEPMTETGEEPMTETGEEEPAVEEPAEKEPGT
jgi:tetratricopeptide (TPR) repeat protein